MSNTKSKAHGNVGSISKGHRVPRNPGIHPPGSPEPSMRRSPGTVRPGDLGEHEEARLGDRTSRLETIKAILEGRTVAPQAMKKLGWGGVRPGAGRPAGEEPKVARTFRLRKSVVQRIGELGTNATTVVETAVEHLFDEVKKV